MLLNRVFYILKPVIPRRLQLFLRRLVVLKKRNQYALIWSIAKEADTKPEGWKGWPDGKKFALVLTHDVDTSKGHAACYGLMELEKQLGFRSSFNFVPERYNVSPILRKDLQEGGFEVGVHGLLHDGKLYSSRKEFSRRALKINNYINEWGAVGFRSPAMHHNLDWIHDLDIKYDASTFDTDPFEPQSDGVNTIFPFRVQNDSDKKGYIELPYTLPQDSTLFILMKERNIDIWKEKLDWIAKRGGMALINVHPDYMNFSGGKLGLEEYPAEYYQDLLEYVIEKYEGQYWHLLPKDLAGFWMKSTEKNE